MQKCVVFTLQLDVMITNRVDVPLDFPVILFSANCNNGHHLELNENETLINVNYQSIVLEMWQGNI